MLYNKIRLYIRKTGVLQMKDFSGGFADAIFGVKSGKKGIELSITLNDAVNVILCFIMSGCTVFGGLAPFGAAAYAAAFSRDRWFVYLAAAVLGAVRGGIGLPFLTHVCSMIGATLFMGFTRSGERVFMRALGAAVSLMTFLICANIITGFYLYDAITALIESVICFGSVYMFNSAVPVIINASERSYISDTEIASVICVFALIVRCLADIPLIFGLNPAVICAIVLLLIINLEGELSAGAAMGVILGLVSDTNTDSLSSSVGAFALASFCSGLTKRFGRWGVVLGFTFADAAMTAFFTSDALPFDIFEVIAAAAIFLVLPKRATSYISSFSAKTVHTLSDTDIARDKLSGHIDERLKRLSESFSALAVSYESRFKKNEMSNRYVIRMLDTASSKICPDCGLKYSCWERGYKSSYKSMLNMLKTAEEKGRLQPSDVPSEFSSRCIKINEFILSFNRMYDIYKVEKLWQSRMNDSRMLVSGQLRAIADSIGNISHEFDMCLDIPAEKQLRTALDRADIHVEDITFLKGCGSDFTAELNFGAKRISKKQEQTVNEILLALTGEKTSMVSAEYSGENNIARFKPAKPYNASCGNAAACKHGESVSGDSFLTCTGSRGEKIAAISDGMGTGTQASVESGTAIELLSEFVDSGMDISASLEMITSSLLLCSSGESFATMDVCSVNLSDGIINFFKSGAAPSYIKNEYGVSKIESDSLPMGVTESGESVKNELYTVENSAMVYMVSDGVADIFCGEKDELPDIIEGVETANPQMAASAILGEALKRSGGKADDDMTVIAVSVWKSV